MATAQQQVELARFYQRQQLALRASTIRNAVALWGLLDFENSARTYPRWVGAARTLVERDGGHAQALGTSYVRQAHLLGTGRAALDIVSADPPNADAVATSLRVTSLVAYRQGLAAGMNPSMANRTALVRSAGTISRLVLNQGRQAVTRTAFANDGRWQRVPSAAACSFCRMLASRGAVYRESSASFASHDHCACTAVSTFGGQHGLPDFTPSLRNISDADRTRVRAWMDAHPDAA